MNNSLYTKGMLKNFIIKIFDNEYVDSFENIQVICPLCKLYKTNNYNKKKLAIYIGEDKKKIGLCKCWVCGYKSKNLLHLIKKHKPNFLEEYINNFKGSILLTDESINHEIIYKPVTLPDEFKLLVLNKNTENTKVDNALNYLKLRGIYKEEDLWYWRFGISESHKGLQNRVIIPSYDNYGKLNYYTGRSMDKNPIQKYANPFADRENIIFNELNIQWDKELTIVEGVFDLIKCNQNATCILGSDLTLNYKLFQKIVLNKTPVLLGLDPDAKKKTLILAERLYEFCVPVRILEYETMNDIGSMTKNQFNDLMEDAIIYDIDYKLRYKLHSIYL